MLKEDEGTQREQDEHDVSKQENTKPNAYRVEDDNNLEEKDLKTHYLFGEGKMKSTTDPGMEGQGMGGQKFGENNLTPSGNDAANPAQNAGTGNAYFNRTQPAEEHPEDSNFKAEGQEGQPNIPGPNELPDQQKVGEDEDKQQSFQKQQGYQEGTADNDGKQEQQSNSPERNHIET